MKIAIAKDIIESGGEAVLLEIQEKGLFSGDLNSMVLSHSDENNHVFLVSKEELSRALDNLDESYLKEFPLYDWVENSENIDNDETNFQGFWDGISFSVISKYSPEQEIKYFSELSNEILSYLREKTQSPLVESVLSNNEDSEESRNLSPK